MNLIYFGEIDSTNDELKRRIRSGNTDISESICAFAQKNGRGRGNRSFVSALGGVYYSIAIPFNKSPITAIAGVVTARTIEEFFGMITGIKWVNDIIYDNFKCAGILAEHIDEKVVLGVGVNVYSKIPESLKGKAISLFDSSEYDKSKLKGFAEMLDINMRKALGNANYSDIIAEYAKRSVILGRKCRLCTPDGSTIAEGVVKGFSSDASIEIETQNGLEKFTSGEISLSCDELYKKCLN